MLHIISHDEDNELSTYTIEQPICCPDALRQVLSAMIDSAKAEIAAIKTRCSSYNDINEYFEMLEEAQKDAATRLHLVIEYYGDIAEGPFWMFDSKSYSFVIQ